MALKLGNCVTACDGAAAAIPFSGIRRASLVVTDDLIEAAAREAKAALSKQ